MISTSPTSPPPAAIAADGPAAAATPARTPRLFFVDFLRGALTMLVVVHHVAVMYGAATPFYYVEPPSAKDALSFLVLLVFLLLNQSYFMGLFFMISGHFTPASFDRKGIVSFLKDRVLRLGIPLAVFWFVLAPVATIGIYQMPASLTHITRGFQWSDYPGLIGAGPLWFVEMLLLFVVGYAGWRLLTRNRPAVTEPSPPPGWPAIAGFVLALAAVSYAFRIIAPLGTSTPVLGFPTPAYIPQYLSFFVLGAVAYRRGWFHSIPASKGTIGFVMALVATIVLLPLSLSGITSFQGNGHWQSATYALWDSTVAVGMALGLIPLFRRLFTRQGALGRFLSQHAFTVYVIHAPVIVFLALALRPVHFAGPQLIKFALAAVIAVPLCFGVAWLVRRLPLVARVM